jgi:Tol biopolymer transport system component
MQWPVSGVRLALASLIGIASLLAPASAVATAPAGPNGDIAFTSGRAPEDNDAQARIWVTGPTGGGATQVTGIAPFVPASVSGQDRQPDWSPDHTKIAYAVGASGSGNYAIRIRDLVAGTDTELVPVATAQDRPTWSPDGTQIAYGSGGKIFVKEVASGNPPIELTDGRFLNNNVPDERPVWDPDGHTIYFNKTFAGPDNDIFKVTSITTHAPILSVVNGATNDWQPAVSPDGSKLCFLRGGKDNTADIYTADTGAVNRNVTEFARDPTAGAGKQGSLNCAWSPDGTKIAFTRGIFGAGQLVVKDIGTPSTDPPTTIAQDANSNRFDGNADWAVNFRPACQGASAGIGINSFVRIPLSCTDRDDGSDGVQRAIVSEPGHGNIGAIDDNSNTVIYTPDVDFSGTDTFTFNGTDGNTESSQATVSIRVSNTGRKDATAAKITSVLVSPRTWRRGRRLPAVLDSRAPVGTRISYRLSEKARAALTFSRRAKGRRVGRSCRKPTRKNRRRRACNRYVKAGSLQFDGRAGLNKVRFQGRLSRRKRLAVGRYRLTIAAKDGAGNVSQAAAPVFFRIVRR